MTEYVDSYEVCLRKECKYIRDLDPVIMIRMKNLEKELRKKFCKDEKENERAKRAQEKVKMLLAKI